MAPRAVLPLVCACVAALALSVASGPPAASASAQGCGQVSATYPAGQVGGGSDVRITAVNHIGCKAARTVTAECIRHYTVPGWTAHVSSSNLRAIRLTNGRMAIQLEGVAGGAPRCTAKKA